MLDATEMKKEFIGYYDPSEKEIKNTWESGIFAFDANALLNLYRYSEHTRNDFLRALNSIKKSLFLPHQAALEYHSNRIHVIEGVGNSYSQIENIIETNLVNGLEPQLKKYKKHPSIVIDKIYKLYTDFQKRVSEELDKQQKKHPDFKNKDDVLDNLTNLFKDSIGKEFSKKELDNIYSEGEKRYLEKIPPGFKDWDGKKKRGLRHVYGDLIIWKELINLGSKENNPLIFVTDDRKEDWWRIENGRTIRPREELIKEFFDSTGIRILIYNSDSFLHYAKVNGLLPKVKDETIEEVKDIRISDEINYSRISDILSQQPSLGNILNNQPSLSDILSQQPSLGNILSQQPSLGDILNNQPSLTDIINQHLTLGDVLNKQSNVNDQANPTTSNMKVAGEDDVSENEDSESGQDK